MAVKVLSSATVNNGTPSYLVIGKMLNGYIVKGNGNKYLTLTTTDGSKDTLKRYEELRNEIRVLTRSISNNYEVITYNYDE